MQLHPNTKLANLLAAIPSARMVCNRFHIAMEGQGDKSLEQFCEEAGIRTADFLRALNDLDWEDDYRPVPPETAEELFVKKPPAL